MAPLPVKVQTGHVCAGHPMDHSVRVNHGYDIHLKLLKQMVADPGAAEELCDHRFDYKGPYSFTGVLPSHDDDSFLFLGRVRFPKPE